MQDFAWMPNDPDVKRSSGTGPIGARETSHGAALDPGGQKVALEVVLQSSSTNDDNI